MPVLGIVIAAMVLVIVDIAIHEIGSFNSNFAASVIIRHVAIINRNLAVVTVLGLIGHGRRRIIDQVLIFLNLVFQPLLLTFVVCFLNITCVVVCLQLRQFLSIFLDL